MASVRRADLGERGKTGLLAYSGQVQEAYISRLYWPTAYTTYDLMRRRDPTIGAMEHALILLARTASWYVEVGGQRSDGDERAAEFVEQCIGDMSHTIEDAIEDSLSCVLLGWSWDELCYKRRRGERTRLGSQYDDGRIGWRKWAPRRQSSFSKWEFDSAGGVSAMVQRPAPTYDEIRLPIEKALHFRGRRDGNSPEGKALLENLYEPWYFLKNLHIISGIGWQRTFVGLPVFEFEEKPDDSDKAAVESVGQALAVDEKQYVSVPKGIRFRLESAANSGAESLLNQMKYERRMMFQTLLADFLDLGTGQTGSWALGSDKSQLFLMAVDGILDRMESVINRFGVTRLMGYNQGAFPGMTGLPKIAHKKVEKPSLPQLGSWLQQVGQMLTWSEEDETWLRHRAGMPTATVGASPAPAGGQSEEEDNFGAMGGGLRELAAGRGPEVDQAEEELVARIEEMLSEQEERVLERARRNAEVASDNPFWAGENQILTAAFIPLLAEALIGVGEARADALGLDWMDANAEALAWVREYTFDLVTGLNDTTRETLRRAMEAWIETGGDVEDLRKMLAPTFGEKRAQRIAASEATRANAEGAALIGQELGIVYAYKPPTRTNCRCWTVERQLPDGTWVGVWMTANDERVSTKPLDTPWGVVQGDRALQGVIVSEGPWTGRRYDEVRREMAG